MSAQFSRTSTYTGVDPRSRTRRNAVLGNLLSAPNFGNRNVHLGTGGMGLESGNYPSQGPTGHSNQVIRETMSKFSMKMPSSGFPLDLNQVATQPSTNMSGMFNRPKTFTIIPSKNGQYEKFIDKDDLIFSVEDDAIRHIHSISPKRTCFNYQSLNHHLFVKKAEAMKDVYRTVKGYKNKDGQNHIDYDILLQEYRERHPHIQPIPKSVHNLKPFSWYW